MTRRRRISIRPQTDAMVSLYDIDITPYGGGVLYWTPGTLSTGGNLLVDPSLERNDAGYVVVGSAGLTVTDGRAVTLGSQWDCRGFSSGYARAAAGLGSGAAFSITATGQPNSFATQPSMSGWYEAQVRVQPHRCKVTLTLIFRDASNVDLQTTGVGVATAEVSSTTGYSKASEVDDYTRLWVQAQAPAGAAKVFLRIRATESQAGLTDCYVFHTMSQIAKIQGPSSEPLPYTDESMVGSVKYDGITYAPVPLQIEKMQWTGQGPIPRPQITVPNINGFIQQYMVPYNDLLGCRISRKRVYARFLDGAPEADPTDYFGPDVYYIDRVAFRAPEAVTFELASPLDIQGKQLPGRQVIRDICTRTYRVWNPGVGWVMGNCPYAGGSYWKDDGTSTGDPAEDDCGRRISDCTLRFPNDPLPTWAFPGVVRSRL